jgi:hypothetical protein
MMVLSQGVDRKKSASSRLGGSFCFARSVGTKTFHTHSPAIIRAESAQRFCLSQAASGDQRILEKVALA